MQVQAPAPSDVTGILNDMVTDRGRTVDAASHTQAVLLVFLRHFGCTFCREALSDLSQKREGYQNEGIQLILVHMGKEEEALRYFHRYQLDGVEHVSDPECRFYAAMGLAKGNFSQLFGLQVMLRGVQAGLIHGRAIARQIGDGFQMPGVFLIQNGIVRDQFVHKLASDRPNYDALVSCCILP